MSKKRISVFFLFIFFISLGCTNVGKPSKKHHKGPKTKASGTMNRYK